MFDGRRPILTPFTGCKKLKSVTHTSKKKTKFSWNTGDHIATKGWLVEFSDSKGAFCNGNGGDNSDNDDENCNENNEQ